VPLQKKGGMFFVDILLNHTSFDSEWIQKHPDATFTIENTPKLTSAYILDKAVRDWGD
jgi:glycogen debranching enzyme